MLHVGCAERSNFFYLLLAPVGGEDAVDAFIGTCRACIRCNFP
jgi:hypothetical protein